MRFFRGCLIGVALAIFLWLMVILPFLIANGVIK